MVPIFPGQFFSFTNNKNTIDGVQWGPDKWLGESQVHLLSKYIASQCVVWSFIKYDSIPNLIGSDLQTNWFCIQSPKSKKLGVAWRDMDKLSVLHYYLHEALPYDPVHGILPINKRRISQILIT